MKKIFLIVSALILTAACTAPSTNNATPPANTNASPPATAAMTEADAIAKEKAIWDAIKNKDYDAFGNMLAEDQIEVTGEAVYDKTGSIASVKKFEPTEVTFSDWKFMSLDKDSYVVTYTANMKGKYDGKELPSGAGRCSSAWVNRGGKWLAIYHQECPVKPPMPPMNSPAKAAASPAGTPAVVPATGPDPIANEKIVWDLFKAKNYDGFGSLLAPGFIEIEPDGLYDKAAAVKGVQGMDASKAVLSDWKALTIDEDAAIVTYTFKMPSMPGMKMPADGDRHSSIWVKQGGSWLAVLHHGGTAVTKPGAMAPAADASPAAKMSPSPAAKMSPSPATKASPAMKATKTP